MLKVNYKKLSLILMSGFVLTACSRTKEVNLDNINSGIDSVKEVGNVKIPEKTIEPSFTVEDKFNYNNDEIAVLNYFDDLKNSVEVQETKEIIIKKFIKITDFIFYNGEINGIKYSDLKDQAKEQTLKDYYEIDSLIENKFPNYKESLDNKYTLAKNYLQEKYNDLSNKTKQSFSDDTINSYNITKEELNDAKDAIKDTSSHVYEDTKVKVKTWYGDLKTKYGKNN